MLDIEQIRAILPHRYPFLLVDRILELDPGKRAVGLKNVSVNEDFFNGHFPGHPVMPGVLILEALAQACAILAYKSASFDPKTQVVYLMAIDGAKFRKPVVPGDRLTLTVEVIRHKSAIWKQRGTASVDGAVVAEAEFLATVMSNQKPVAP